MMIQVKAKRARRRERGRFKQYIHKNDELWEGWKRSIRVDKGVYSQVFESPVISIDPATKDNSAYILWEQRIKDGIVRSVAIKGLVRVKDDRSTASGIRERLE